MISFLLGLSSTACLLAWLIWRDARSAPNDVHPKPRKLQRDDQLSWRPKRPYRTLR